MMMTVITTTMTAMAVRHVHAMLVMLMYHQLRDLMVVFDMATYWASLPPAQLVVYLN
jgi:hypothetical protein